MSEWTKTQKQLYEVVYQNVVYLLSKEMCAPDPKLMWINDDAYCLL